METYISGGRPANNNAGRVTDYDSNVIIDDLSHKFGRGVSFYATRCGSLITF